MKTKCIKAVFLVLSLGLMAACGGGGGGGGTTTGSYSGVTTQATVTSSNATALSSGAYENGSAGAAASISGVEVQALPAQPVLPEVGAALKESIARAIDQQTSTNAATGVAVSYTFNGIVSGSATYSIDVNPNGGSFTGTLTYTNFKETQNGPALSGTVIFTGVFNSTSGTFGSLTITFAPLTATTASGTSTLNGSMSFSTTGTSETLTISCTVQKAGETHWVKDWSYTYTLTTPHTLTITGRYYHPTYGYVDVTTLTPLSVSSVYGQPTAGVLLFTGANGTKAKLTFTSSGYTVTVDTAGNGQFVAVP